MLFRPTTEAELDRVVAFTVEEQFTEQRERLQVLADEHRDPSGPSLPDASLVFALFRPTPRQQVEGDAR